MDALTEYLASLTSEQLTTLIADRPEAQLPPEPTTLAELSARLGKPFAIAWMLTGLTRPELQVVEVLAMLRDGARRADLAALIGVAEDDPVLAVVLARLAQLAVAWPEGDLIRTVALSAAWPEPLGLGLPLATALGRRRAEDLREIARNLGISGDLTKDAMVTALTRWLGEPTNVRRLVAGAPKSMKDQLERLAWHGPYLFSGYGPGPDRAGPNQWAIERGLLCEGDRHGWGSPLEMPGEIALALRGPAYRLPFDPVPPACPTVPVNPVAVEREAAVAVGAAVTAVAAVLDESAKTPIALLKAGGVGVREARRLAKLVGIAEDDVRMWLDVAVAAGLAATTMAGLFPTDEYDRWRRREPAEQLLVLLDGWQRLGVGALVRQLGDIAAFVDSAGPGVVTMLRAAVLTVAASVPEAYSVPDLNAVATLVRWLRPSAADVVDDHDNWDDEDDRVVADVLDETSDSGENDALTSVVGALWQEAQLFGVVAHDAPTRLGRALATFDPALVQQVAAELMPNAVDTVLIQNDLTAVVTGTPAGGITAVLDRCADRESRGGAWTWRFSADSVRRAFDAGATGEELLAALRSIAAGGRLPQPLEYLIADVGRRHGLVRVRPVACTVRCDDPALVAEILHTKSLTKLGLTELAPTVLASGAPAAETLRALRAAGYAPAGENPDGTLALERLPRQRAISGVGLVDTSVPDGQWSSNQNLYGDGVVGRAIEGNTLGGLINRLSGKMPDGLLDSMLGMSKPGPVSTPTEPAELARRLRGDHAAGKRPPARPQRSQGQRSQGKR